MKEKTIAFDHWKKSGDYFEELSKRARDIEEARVLHETIAPVCNNQDNIEENKKPGSDYDDWENY